MACPCPDKKRACFKTAIVVFFTLAAIAAIACALPENALSGLKENLSLWTIIAVVAVINLVSFLCFILAAAAYQWIRRDLKPVREEDIAPPPS